MLLGKVEVLGPMNSHLLKQYHRINKCIEIESQMSSCLVKTVVIHSSQKIKLERRRMIMQYKYRHYVDIRCHIGSCRFIWRDA